MGSFSFWHWMIVMIVILVVFGAGKLPNVMGDVAKGLKAFKREMANDGKAPAQEKTAAPDIQKET